MNGRPMLFSRFDYAIHLNILYLNQIYISPITRLKAGSKTYNLCHERCTADLGKASNSETIGIILYTY